MSAKACSRPARLSRDASRYLEPESSVQRGVLGWWFPARKIVQRDANVILHTSRIYEFYACDKPEASLSLVENRVVTVLAGWSIMLACRFDFWHDRGPVWRSYSRGAEPLHYARKAVAPLI